MHASNGILFNHESPLRGEMFVTRKITRGLARVAAGLQTSLRLGNLDSERDWGHAQDYVLAEWLIAQQEAPDDYVIATGEKHSVREFTTRVAMHLGMQIEWLGTGCDEQGIDTRSGRVVVEVDKQLFRPTDIDALVGDASKARRVLGWAPTRTLNDVIAEMVDADAHRARRERRDQGESGIEAESPGYLLGAARLEAI